MIKRFGKNLDVNRLQTRVSKDIKSYQKMVVARAKKYIKKANVSVNKCYICGKSSAKPLVSVFKSKYVQCTSCTHVFLNKRLSSASLTAFYSESDSYSKTYTDKRQVEYRRLVVAEPKVQFVINNTRFSRKTLKWLDVGCAIGDIIYSVEKIPRWHGIGIDISKKSIQFGKKVFKIDLRQQIFKVFANENSTTSFDVISFFGYLSLITDPLTELKIAKKKLNKGGYIVIGEENALSLSTLVQQNLPSITSRHLIPPNIIHMFTFESLSKALSLANLEVCAVWYFGLDFYEIIKLIALKSKATENDPLVEFLINNYNDFQQVIDNKERSDYFVVIAKPKT